jgi:protein-L-isoaspartate(D-aspartate) O-methyltransferase
VPDITESAHKPLLGHLVSPLCFDAFVGDELLLRVVAIACAKRSHGPATTETAGPKRPMANKPESARTQTLRYQMVKSQIEERGIRDEHLLKAMRALPRHWFVPQGQVDRAYDDRALPIGHDQTISQPFIVAFMTEQLSLTHESKVLEVGTGTGYQTALLALLASHVHSVERIDALHRQASFTLERFGFTNVSLYSGDGTLGLAERAPFDRILVTAAAPDVPAPLLEQLADPGVLVIPTGNEEQQAVVRITKSKGSLRREKMLACRFVKLIGSEGWPDGTELA